MTLPHFSILLQPVYPKELGPLPEWKALVKQVVVVVEALVELGLPIENHQYLTIVDILLTSHSLSH